MPVVLRSSAQCPGLLRAAQANRGLTPHCLCNVHTGIYLFNILTAVPWTRFCLPVDGLVDLSAQGREQSLDTQPVP